MKAAKLRWLAKPKLRTQFVYCGGPGGCRLNTAQLWWLSKPRFVERRHTAEASEAVRKEHSGCCGGFRSRNRERNPVAVAPEAGTSKGTQLDCGGLRD